MISVELGNLVQNVDCLCVSSSADEELGRLAEGEDKETQEEDKQGSASEDDERVSPTHVAAGSATGSFASAAGGIFCIATPLGPCSCAVGDQRCNNDTNGLPQREESDEEAAVLGKKLEGDGCVNGDVAAEAQ
jgi:hypothetical protein